MQEESSEDELPQFTPAGMKTLIDICSEGEFMCFSGNKEDMIRSLIIDQIVKMNYLSLPQQG